MAPKVLKEFSLDISLDQFLSSFWFDKQWYEAFLVDRLEDINVHVGEWNVVPGSSSQSRNIRSFHPSKISFPGLASHAESLKTQTLHSTEDFNIRKVIIKESNSFKGIPYADFFNVDTEWSVISSKPGSVVDNTYCKIIITFDFVFHKSTWLQSTIEANTKAELLCVYDHWITYAEEWIETRNPITIANHYRVSLSSAVYCSSMKQSDYVSDEELQFYDCEDGGERQALATLKRIPSEVFLRTPQPLSRKPFGAGASVFDSSAMSSSSSSLRSAESPSTLKTQHSLQFDIFRLSAAGPQVAKELLLRELEASRALEMQGCQNVTMSAHDVAVVIVETAFVFAEYSYWKIHEVYSVDMKEIFDVEPMEVYHRIVCSFFPGWHSPVLHRPDVYGPIIAVFSLPQVLLLSLDLYSSDGSCSHTSLLGSAVVVSLCLWLGLSSLYRLLAFVIAPTIAYKHCLSMVGYSFFSWSLALTISYPIEAYSDRLSFSVPVAVPILLCGFPSAVAQGCMFWEHTPASSATLAPAPLAPSSSVSMQRWAKIQTRILQRLLWAVPKILAFVLVAGTHYQFLWYVARVFLPGRRQMCRLSALVQPSKYADILTQKELRKFALQLLGKKGDD